jgi:hypothetical protein
VIFESWAVSEAYKASVHSGMQPNLLHYREARGPAIDLLIEQAQNLYAVEIKSGATVDKDFFENLNRFFDRLEKAVGSSFLTTELETTGYPNHKMHRTPNCWRL